MIFYQLYKMSEPQFVRHGPVHWVLTSGGAKHDVVVLIDGVEITEEFNCEQLDYIARQTKHWEWKCKCGRQTPPDDNLPPNVETLYDICMKKSGQKLI